MRQAIIWTSDDIDSLPTHVCVSWTQWVKFCNDVYGGMFLVIIYIFQKPFFVDVLFLKIEKNVIITRGQLWPSGIVLARTVCLSVGASVCEPWACSRDITCDLKLVPLPAVLPSSDETCNVDQSGNKCYLRPIQFRITKFGPEVQEYLDLDPYCFGGESPWPSRSSLT